MDEIIANARQAALDLTKVRDELRELKEQLLPHLNSGDLNPEQIMEIVELLQRDSAEAKLISRDFANILEIIVSGSIYHGA
jgi:hypothetical protein